MKIEVKSMGAVEFLNNEVVDIYSQYLPLVPNRQKEIEELNLAFITTKNIESSSDKMVYTITSGSTTETRYVYSWKHTLCPVFIIRVEASNGSIMDNIRSNIDGVIEFITMVYNKDIDGKITIWCRDFVSYNKLRRQLKDTTNIPICC